MAEATTTRPARPRKATAAKAAAPAAEATEAVTPTGNRVTLELEPTGETKTYAKFGYPEGSGCTGTLYAPKGTTAVKVLLISE